jgi:RimJ/RimL family protein N-acetyltransferase
MNKVIQTPRLKLRPTQVSDAPRLFALMRDESVACMTSSVPHPSVLTPIGVEGQLLLWEAERGLGVNHRFAIDLPGPGLIGVIGGHDLGGDRFMLGYWVGRDYRAQGYATEAACAMVAFVRQLGAREITAAHFADNPASGRVLEKAGFAYTGNVREAYSLGRGVRAQLREMAA